jgi:TPR repeat protein
MVAELITLDGGYAHYSHFFYTNKGGDCVFPLEGGDCVFPLEGGDSRTKCKNLPLPQKATLALMIPWGAAYTVSGATSSGKPVSVEGLIINPRDPSEAIDIYLPKAQAGDAEAQYQIGLLYIAEGPKHDIKAARKWLEAAATQDFEEAQVTLARDYDYALLGPADSAKSFFWWSVLAREKPLGGFTGYRDLAGTHLTSAQRADVGKQADAWKPQVAAHSQ